MQTLRQDVSYALRQMRLSPVFTLTAMLTLALGIGATTAIFSLIYSVMLKSLPVVDPSTLYRIGAGTDCCVQGGPQDDWGMYSYPLFVRLQAAAPEFDQSGATGSAGRISTGGHWPSYWHSNFNCLRPFDCSAVVSGQELGPAGAERIDRRAGLVCAGRERDSCTASGFD
jgi:hypothetical protein